MAQLTHTDVQLVFLKQGIDGIDRVITEGLASSYTLRRALGELEADDVESAADLRAILTDKGFLGTPLLRPDVGDTKGYSMQKDGNRQILKVPTDHLGMPNGTIVDVTFTLDGFIGKLSKEG